jgi:hypothetical protein
MVCGYQNRALYDPVVSTKIVQGRLVSIIGVRVVFGELVAGLAELGAFADHLEWRPKTFISIISCHFLRVGLALGVTKEAPE